MIVFTSCINMFPYNLEKIYCIIIFDWGLTTDLN